MLQALRVLLHQLRMHPLILLFELYIILGHLYAFCRLFMKTTDLMSYLDGCWFQVFAAPLVLMIISEYIGGVVFDIMHINDLIVLTWELVLRRAVHGLRKLGECQRNGY